MNIYQKLQNVMRQVAYVQKDKDVKTGGGSYRAVTHDMVTAVVRPHFVEQGIITVPRLISGSVVDTNRKTSSGNPIIRFEGSYDVSFVNADTPMDFVTVPVAAHAEDQGDKAPGKALSYATKYAILKVLMLETGENDEGRVTKPEDEVDPLTEEQISALKSSLDPATNKDELRVAMRSAYAVCADAKDPDAHAAIKAYGMTLAANLGA